METEPVRCQCCGVAVTGTRAHLRRCPICDMCDGVHGFERHQQVIRMVAMGRLSAWSAIAMVAFDDAWLAGKLAIDLDGCVSVAAPVKRWEVLLGWCRCGGVKAPMAALVDAALAPFAGVDPSPETMDRVRAEIRTAVAAWDPDARIEFVDTPSSSASVVFDDKTVTLPVDMIARPRGSA